MGRKPLFFDIDAFWRDLDKRFEEEELLHDFKVFLSYTIKNKIRLTPKYRWIPRKHLYAINALFRNPSQMDHKVKDKIYKTREECQVPRIYFIDLLAEASECIIPDNRDDLIPGPEYDKFMSMDGFSKKKWLMLAWWFGMDWDTWMPEGDFGGRLQEKHMGILPYIKQVCGIRHMINFKKFSNTLIDDLSLEWNAQSQSSARDGMRWGIERCILLPLSWFEVIEFCYNKPDKWDISSIRGFHICPMGDIFLKELVNMGEGLAVSTNNN